MKNKLKRLKKELEKLRKKRKKSKDKAFVMDTYMYEDSLLEQIKELR